MESARSRQLAIMANGWRFTLEPPPGPAVWHHPMLPGRTFTFDEALEADERGEASAEHQRE